MGSILVKLKFAKISANLSKSLTTFFCIFAIRALNNFPVRAALPPNRPHAAEVDCLVFKRAASADLISTKVVRLLYASSA